jgi:Spy/CpxP family protein refolding chaperone
MRTRFLALAACSLLALTACSSDPVVPDGALETDDLVPDYVISPAAVIDGAGIGASMLPEELKLTAEQKAAIAALHEAFRQSTADELAALRAIERQLRQLRRERGSRDEIRALLEDAKEIVDALAVAFEQLQEDIWAVYTPEQRAWIESHRPRVCGPDGPPRLSEAQVTQIRALREAFEQTIAADVALVKEIRDAAQAARREGKSRAEVEAILATATPALERIRAAERKLHEDIMAVLTPDQRARWCIVRRHVTPRHHG